MRDENLTNNLLMKYSPLAFFLFLCFFLISNTSVADTNTPATHINTSNESLVLMDDKQVRAILVDLLKQQQQNTTVIDNEESTDQFTVKKDELFSNLQRADIQFNTIWRNMSLNKGATGFGILIVSLIVTLSIALIGKFCVSSLLNNRLSTTTQQQLPSQLNTNFIIRILSTLGFYAFGVVFILSSTFFLQGLDKNIFPLFNVVALVLLVSTIAHQFLSWCKLSIHKYLSWITAYAILFSFSLFILPWFITMGLEQPIAKIVNIISGICVNLLVNLFVWSKRKEITAFFTIRQFNRSHRSWGNFIWFSLISIWLLSLWWSWANATFLEDKVAQSHVALSWWITILFPIIDRLFNFLLNKSVKHPWLYSSQFEKRSYRFKATLQNGFRLLLLSFAVFLMADSWGYSASSLIQVGWVKWLLVSILNVLLINLCAYIAWTFIQSAIERRLPDNIDEPDESPEGEGGGDGATRSETLLPLLRSFILSFIVVTAVLSSLSSMGVEIAPLLAGAGVLGIAIGFGAQKLVADVISGIFFLLDDAFRKGEYIEAANMRGTVEQISIRSMRLRHHLGAVQTVPYSEVATVKNLSRDWITMKLEFRLPYNTDSEKVRKIIKKVGLSMLEDPEMGPNFILPLKSQGVMRVEESALIFRMKFTSKPGEQWIIRREAYRRVIDALEAQNIQFAHRAVHVLMPDQDDISKKSEEKLTLDKLGVNTAIATSSITNPSHKIDEPNASGDE